MPTDTMVAAALVFQLAIGAACRDHMEADMPHIRPLIVVGIDESAAGKAALAWAAGYARLIDARMTAVHVRPRETTPYVYAQTISEDPAAAKSRRRIGDLFLDIDREPGWTLLDVTGHVGEELVKAAEHAALLVIGTQQHVGVGRLLDGSVSHYCIRHASVPVLCVPNPSTFERRRNHRNHNPGSSTRADSLAP